MSPADDIEKTNEYAKSVLPQKSKKTISKILIIILIALILVAGSVWAGMKWKSQIDEYKLNQENANKTITELELKLRHLNTAGVTGSDSLTQKDVDEIHKALIIACNDGTSSQKYAYLASDENAKLYTKITLDFFKLSGQNNTPKYAKGNAAVAIGCRESQETDKEEGGGYVSILQRQTNGTWKQALGIQGIPSCDMVDRYNIPKEIIPDCYTNQGVDLVENDN